MAPTFAAQQQRLLDQLVEKLRAACGDNLAAVVLYGSAATADFSPQYSNLNVLCLIHRIDVDDLAKAAPVLRWWEEQKQPAALLFTLEELRRSADVFAIELYDIKAQHRTIFGEDHISSIEVPMHLHRVQVERELRTNLIRLRQRFGAAAGNDKALTAVMLGSSSTFHTLFRHVLIAMGEPAPSGRREVLDTLDQLVQVDTRPLRTVLELREGTINERSVNVAETFAGYLRAISAAVDQVDRLLGH